MFQSVNSRARQMTGVGPVGEQGLHISTKVVPSRVRLHFNYARHIAHASYLKLNFRKYLAIHTNYS